MRRVEATRPASSQEDDIVALRIERAGLLAIYAEDNPIIQRQDEKIRTAERAEMRRQRSRYDGILDALQEERAAALRTYAADHDRVKVIDAKIAFLRAELKG